ELVRELKTWAAPTAHLEQLREEYLAFVDQGGATALLREHGAAHLTASCFIFSADLEQTLLCFHRKGRFWVQTGGHVEPEDGSVPAAALREAREEAGLTALSLVPGVLDLDRHELAAAFGACRTHWDVGFAAVATTGELPRVSEESEQVGWFSIDDLPAPLAGSVATRLQHLRDIVQKNRRGRSSNPARPGQELRPTTPRCS
ncbi:MAG: NUDIX hydrolase, partial [Janthinobacterium lividum]